MDGQARFAFLNACQALIQQGRAHEAEQAARKVLADDPDFTEARMMLALLLTQTSRWEEAAKELERVIAAEPKRRQAILTTSIDRTVSFVPANMRTDLVSLARSKK